MVAAENGVKMAAEDVGSPRGVKGGVVEKADASENTGLKCGARATSRLIATSSESRARAGVQKVAKLLVSNASRR